MTKALFLDIDGTLVSFQTHAIPPSAIEALAEAKAKGVRIFIATGRPRILINNLTPLEERGLIDGFITMNGAYCFVGDEVIYQKPISIVEKDSLMGYCDRFGIPCIVVDQDSICVVHPNEQVDEVFRGQLGVTVDIPAVRADEALARVPYQMTAFLNVEHEQEVTRRIPRCEIGRWHPAFVDVTAAGNNKQKGMDEIIAHFQIPLSETMAFGDGGNDISMLRHAGIGIAMGNARDQVKQAADYVTTSVDDNGIANALRHFQII